MKLSDKYRPTTFEQIIGNATTVNTVRAMLDKPEHSHCYLITGSYGCGKSTMAQVMADYLGASTEIINASGDGGVDTVAEIQDICRYGTQHPRVFIWEECHGITGKAQEKLKLMTESPDAMTYHFFVTDRAEKMDKALKSRCTPIEMVCPDEDVIAKYLKFVAKEEEATVATDLIYDLAEHAQGSMRDALKYLEMAITNPDSVRDITMVPEKDADAFDIAKAVVSGEHWRNISQKIALCKKATKPTAETIRRTIIAYATTRLLAESDIAKGMQCVKVIDTFRNEYLDAQTSWGFLAADICISMDRGV
jgi:DNA polymerase-3 subunit gamma/tau